MYQIACIFTAISMTQHVKQIKKKTLLDHDAEQ